MNFPQAIASGFRNVFNYKARASRSEFWWFWLFSWFFLFLGVLTGPFFLVFGITIYLTTLSLSVRRFHDSNHRGWWIFVPIVPIIFTLIKGTEGKNRFGENPLNRRASGDASAAELLSRDDPPQDVPRA